MPLSIEPGARVILRASNTPGIAVAVFMKRCGRKNPHRVVFLPDDPDASFQVVDDRPGKTRPRFVCTCERGADAFRLEGDVESEARIAELFLKKKAAEGEARMRRTILLEQSYTELELFLAQIEQALRKELGESHEATRYEEP